MKSAFLLLSFALSVRAQDYSKLPPVYVETTKGRIRGSRLTTPNGNVASLFLGIPFGESTSGFNRFQPPVPKRPWKGTLNCTNFGTACPIHLPDFFSSLNKLLGEDCLNLNVHQGAGCDEIGAKCPVVVYIFGGGHITGIPAEYRPEDWVDIWNTTEMILVTPNYRLGMLGFWNTGSDEALGNNALLDMMESLRWVQTEIANFGGDPDRVTLMGLSSSSMDITAISLSPKSKRLFKNILAMSGSGQSFEEFADVADISKQLARELNCSTEETWKKDSKTISQTVACLQSVPVADLIKVQAEIDQDSLSAYGPRIDGPNGLFPESVKTLTKNRHPYPLLAGTVQKEEATYKYVVPNADRKYIETGCAIVAEDYGYKPSKTLVETCARVYNSSGFDYPNQFALLASDAIFYIPVMKEVIAMAATGAPVYLYQFDYVKEGLEETFPSHADDVCYFVGSFACHIPLNDDDYKMRKIYSKLLTNYVRFQDPTPNDWMEMKNWELFNSTSTNYYSINLESENKNGYHKVFMDFWLKTASEIDDPDLFELGVDGPNVTVIRRILRVASPENTDVFEIHNLNDQDNGGFFAFVLLGSIYVVSVLLVVGYIASRYAKNKQTQENSETRPLLS